jgi:hypothetical protein
LVVLWRRRRFINLVRSPSPNYVEVEARIGDAVLRHVPGKRRSSSDEVRSDAVNLTLFLRDPGDVIMSHGVADKRYFWMRDEQRRPYVERFGDVLLPGRWLRDRLIEDPNIEVDPERLHVVGWPRLDDLLPLQRRWDANDVPPDERRLRVLWAPTHDLRKRGPERRSTSSYPDFEAHLPALAEHADVRTSLHPRNRADKTPTEDALVWADVVISDFGTMVYEAWALGKPVIFPRWILGERLIEYQPRSTEAHLHRENIGLHPGSIDELIDTIRARPTVGEDVRGFLDDYLAPDSYGSSGQRAAAVLEQIRLRRWR